MTSWKALPASLVLLLLLALAPAASAHPPAADPHNSCTGNPFFLGPPVPTFPIPMVNSYLGPSPASLPCAGPAEVGSHEGPCPPLPFVGVAGNKFCGPLVPAGGAATCTWAPVIPGTQAIVQLVVGFDGNLDGLVTVVPPPIGGPLEFPVSGPIPPGSWTIPNPLPVKARVIAYPTDVALGGAILPLPIPTLVGC